MYLLLQELQRILCQMGRVQKHLSKQLAGEEGRHWGENAAAEYRDNNWAFRDSMVE